MPQARSNKPRYRVADLIVMPFTPQQPGVPFGPPGLEEDVKPFDPVVFMEAPEEKELPMAARLIKEAVENPSAPLTVKVVAPYRVTHQGVGYTGGDVIEVPNDKEHDIWLKSGWVELVKEK
jgi:hypothetical protein